MKRLAKILLPVVAILLVAAVLILPGYAEGTETIKFRQGNLTWTLDPDGLLTISGKGDMKDFINDHIAVWPFRDKGVIKAVVIEEGVTSIGHYAFKGCYNLTSITIPDSLTSIANTAFDDCDSLTGNLYDNAHYVGIAGNPYYLLFRVKDKSIASCIIPPETEVIASRVFQDCTNLTSITIPGRVTSIPSHTFYGCTGLTSVTIENGVTGISDWVFSGCSSLTSITIPDGVTDIGRGAFENCTSLPSVTIPDSLTGVGYRPFDGCTGLKSVTLENGLAGIWDTLFAGCTGLTDITIPDSVTYIGDSAFAYCTNLTSIILSDGVTSFGNYAFYECGSLASIIIPDSVIKIGECAFEGCTKLIQIEDGVHYVDKWVCCYGENVVAPVLRSDSVGIVDHAFRLCKSLTGITIPDGVRSIGAFAFACCEGLTSIVIPEGVSRIDRGAFSGCTGLTSITFNGTAPEIGQYAFSDVTATAHYPKGNSTWTAAVRWDYGGTITWISYEKHTHSYEAVTVEPTCTEAGYTTYTCECGDTYTEEIAALGHSFVEGVCEHCGATGHTLGDADGNGKVNARDVRALLQYLASMLAEDADFNEEAADIDGNGKINARDVRALLNLLAGIG